LMHEGDEINDKYFCKCNDDNRERTI